MRISETMTKDVRLLRPEQSIREAAEAMREIDAGMVPITDGDRLIGIITDRDIAIRAVGNGKPCDTPVKEIMSRDVCYCFDDQDVSDVADNMAQIKVRRLPVVDREKRLVGIVSIADIALSDGSGDATTEAVCGVSVPGGKHSQVEDGRPLHA